MAEHCQALFEGRIPGHRLLVNMPPRMLKSIMFSVVFPIWCWLQNPSLDIISLAYSKTLADRDSGRSRDLLKSDLFRRIFPGRATIRMGHNRINDFRINDEGNYIGGRRMAFPFTGIMGHGCDIMIIDDAHDPTKGYQHGAIERVLSAWTGSIRSREHKPGETRILAGMQRVYPEDLSNLLLVEGFEHLCLPQEYDPDNPSPSTSIGFSDPRSEPGELIDPRRWPEDRLQTERHNPFTFAAQHNQNPLSESGGIFKREWFRWYRPGLAAPYFDHDLWRIIGMPEHRPILVWPEPTEWSWSYASWDIASTERSASDRASAATTGSYWKVPAAAPADRYWVDEEWCQVDPTEVRERVHAFAQTHPANATIIEAKETGRAIISDLKSLIHGVEGFNPGPYGDKTNRAVGICGTVKEGHVYLPHPDLSPLTADNRPKVLLWLSEVCQVPNGRWDRTDAFVQLQLYEAGKGSGAGISMTSTPEDAKASAEDIRARARIKRRSTSTRDRIMRRMGRRR